MLDKIQDSSPQAMPYDSVFKTVMARMTPLLLPLLNSLFGTDFTGDEKITQGATETVERQPDGRWRTTRADSHITVIESSGTRHMFHIEAQTGYDNQIILRFFEYDMLLALQEPVASEDGIGLPIPESAVIYLRPVGDKAKKPKYWLFDPRTGERLFEREIRVLPVADLTVDKIFADQLYPLLPFYLFTHGNQLTKLEQSKEGRRELVREAEEMADRITSVETLTPEQQLRLLELIGVVARGLLKDETAKEISDIMQGHVLEFDIDRMLDASKTEGIEIGKTEGIKIGKTEGIEEGMEIGKVELLVQMGESSGQTEHEIVQNVAYFLGTDEEKARALYEQYLENKCETAGERNGRNKARV